jgi:hypothetical protein
VVRLAENQQVNTEGAEDLSKWPLPFNLGIDKFDIIVKAFFQAEADSKDVDVSSLTGRTGLNLTTIKSNLKFFTSIGLLKPGQAKDTYNFEPKGAAYAKALSLKDETRAKDTLNELLSNSYLKDLIGYIELQTNIDYDQLFQHIKAMARLKEDSKYPRGVSGPYSAGISTLIGLLSRAGFVPEIMEKKEPVRTQPSVGRKIAQTSERVKPIDAPPIALSQSIPQSQSNLPFNININVEAKDAESIKQLITLFRELMGKKAE